MNRIIEELTTLSKFQEYSKKIQEKISPITVSGLSDVGKIQFVVGTYESTKKPICIVTYNEMQARRIKKDFSFFDDYVRNFPKRDIISFDYIAESKDVLYDRISTLNDIVDKKSPIIITTIEAIMQKMITKESLYKNLITLKVGDEISLEKLKNKLILLRI